MPTVFRFVTILAIAAGIVFAAMLALAFLVKPTPRQIVVPVSIVDQMKQGSQP